MGTIDPTARYASLRARVNSYIAAQTIHGAPTVVLDGQGQSDHRGKSPWLRVQVDPIQETDAGHYSATQRAFRAVVLLSVDCFVPDGTDRTVADGYEIDRIADDVAHALRMLSLTWRDYSSDPSSPVDVANAPIRVLRPPTIKRLSSSDGYARRQVLAEAEWMLRHTA